MLYLFYGWALGFLLLWLCCAWTFAIWVGLFVVMVSLIADLCGWLVTLVLLRCGGLLASGWFMVMWFAALIVLDTEFVVV